MLKFLKKFYIFIIFTFLYAPIAVLIVYSFNSRKSSKWGGFTFDWYIQLFQDKRIMNSWGVTLRVAIFSAIIATVIGTMAAIGISNMKKRTKAAVLSVNNIPVTNPDIITGVSLMLLFIALGFERGELTLLLAHITFNIPYVILSVLPKLRQTNNLTYEAALDLGATPFSAFWKVVFHEIKPGIFTGFLLAFTLSFDDFMISNYTGGTAQTLAVTIFSMTKKKINPKIYALSSIMFLTVLILLVIVNLRQSKDNKNNPKKERKLKKVEKNL